MKKTAKHLDKRGESYEPWKHQKDRGCQSSAPMLLVARPRCYSNRVARPRHFVARPRYSGREKKPVSLVSDPFEGPFAVELKGRLGGPKT